MIFVDCVRLLADFPKSKILQHDGFHLSRLGQDLVGEATGHAIIGDVVANGNLGSRASGVSPPMNRHRAGQKPCK